MKNRKLKVLLLSDLKKSAKSQIVSTISLAKMIDGEVTLFHVKKPTDVVAKSNQLSAMRSINREHLDTTAKIKKLKQNIHEEFGFNLSHKCTLGNVKNEIKSFISEFKPDVIVLGKPISKSFNLFGDHIATYVLNNFSGTIFIADENNVLQPNNELQLGMLNYLDNSSNNPIFKGLTNNLTQPIKSFKIAKTVENGQKLNAVAKNKTVEYIFEQNDSSFENISNYASKSNINLMCISTNNQNDTQSSIKNMINKLNVSLLLTGEHQLIAST